MTTERHLSDQHLSDQHLSDQHLSEKTTAALDKSIKVMSVDTQDKLQAARREALARHSVITNRKAKHSTRDNQPLNFWSLFTPKFMSAGLAFSVLAFLAIDLSQDNLNNSLNNSASPLIVSNSELSEFILSDNFDETELEVVEDIEFAYWLSQELDHNNIDDSRFDGALIDDRQQHNG